MGEREIFIQQTVCESDDGTPGWVVEIESDVERNESLRTEESGAWKKHSIYKLPEGFVGDKEKRFQCYNPQVVSLGPYHHGERQLKGMEKHKLRALRQLLVRTNKSVKDYREALKPRVEALKQGVELQLLMDSYKDLDSSWREDEERFLKLMVLDGCFMLEVIRLATGDIDNDYDENDPIFSRNGLISYLPRIQRDMLMLENQIPLLVLYKLFAVKNDKKEQCDLNQEVNKMVLDFFDIKNETPKQTSAPEFLHVLDVVRKSMIEDVVSKSMIEDGGGKATANSESLDVIWPAIHLAEAGIQLRKSNSTSLKDIIFLPGLFHATLSLPQLLVDDSTESKFLNLIAFEHLHTGSGKEVSSYACFMDNIIDSDKDVSLLCKNDIIKNFVGTDQAVADIFNIISRDASNAGNLDKVHRDVIAYCNNPCNKNCANLKHRYFSSPWSAIAFVAATVALVITIIQFVYTFLSYYLHND